MLDQPNNPALKYRFYVLYKDGTEYHQNEADTSISDSTKSCMFDVKLDELESFTLYGPEGVFRVNLTDGSFEVDSTSFFMHEGELENVRLIFFRRHKHQFNVDYEEQAHTVEFHLGWQALQGGKNVQRVMRIS